MEFEKNKRERTSWPLLLPLYSGEEIRLSLRRGKCERQSSLDLYFYALKNARATLWFCGRERSEYKRAVVARHSMSILG